MSDRVSQIFCGTSEIGYHDHSIRQEKIKLYKIELSLYENNLSILSTALTSLEVKRADRYHHLKDKKRFIVCRSILKYLLARETGLEISQIYFEESENHKPYFPFDRSLFFNIAHSNNFAIIAIGKCELGVDVEFIDKNFDFNEIIPTVFSETEIKYIQNSADKRYSFYKYWTRKEAIVKAIGKGIDDDFHKIPVADGNHAIPTSLVGGVEKMKVFSFNINEDYMGALVITEDSHNSDILAFSPSPTSNELISSIH